MSKEYIRLPDYTATIDAIMTPFRQQLALTNTAAAIAAQSQFQASKIIDSSAMVRKLIPPITVDITPITTALTASANLARVAAQWKAPVMPVAAFMPTFNLPRLIVPMPKIEFPNALAEILRTFDWEAFERRIRTPRNWPKNWETYLPQLMTMLNDEGIPVAWVPNAATLMELIDAGNAECRSELLVERRVEILEDCAAELGEIESELLIPMMPSVEDLIASCRDGHWKTAGLAAVPLIHSVVEALRWPTQQARTKKHHTITTRVTLKDLMEQATRAPLVTFYKDWNPLSGQPRPTYLARHVMSHKFGPEQVTDRNCIVAVMLLTSLFVTVDQLDLAAQESAA